MHKLLRAFALVLLASVAQAQQAQPFRAVAVNSAPAVSTQATVSAPAQDNLRHVVDNVCFSAASTTAPALTLLTVNLRDGATGAGTVIQSFTVAIAGATGQNVPPFCTGELETSGSLGTALTLEFSASLTNLFQNVTLFYHNTP